MNERESSNAPLIAIGAAVLAALKGMTKPASASDLTAVAGGSPLRSAPRWRG